MKNIIYLLIFSIIINFARATTSMDKIIIDDILIDEKSYKESCEIIDAKIRELDISKSIYKGIIYLGPLRGNVFLHITKAELLDVIKYFAEAANCKYTIENGYILLYPKAQETIIIDVNDELAKKIGITPINQNDTEKILKLFMEFGIQLEIDSIKLINKTILITSDLEKIKILKSCECLFKYGFKITK